MPYAKISFQYDQAFGTTPPLVTALDFWNPGSVDAASLDGLTDDVSTAWDDNMAPALSTSTSGGTAIGRCDNGTVVLEAQYPINDGSDSVGAGAVPGASYRVIKTASRPAGGKPGAMFIGGLRAGTYDADFQVNTSVYSAVQGRLDDFWDQLDAIADWVPVVRRNVDGSPSHSTITAFSLKPTMSWLQRRYR